MGRISPPQPLAAAGPRDPLSVGIGALLTLWTVAALALARQRRRAGLVQRVPTRLVRRLTGVVLALLGGRHPGGAPQDLTKRVPRAGAARPADADEHLVLVRDHALDSGRRWPPARAVGVGGSRGSRGHQNRVCRWPGAHRPPLLDPFALAEWRSMTVTDRTAP